MATRVNGKTYSHTSPNYTLNPFFYYTVSETPTTYSLILYGGVKYVGSTEIGMFFKMTGTGQTDKWTYENASTSKDYIYITSYTWSWNKTKSTQSKTINAMFGNIKPDFSPDYDSYLSYKATKAFTIPTITTYAITYNANGGTGAPTGQTKWYGEDINLQAGIPTRAGYSFKCWNTKQDGTGTNYNPSQKYSTNAALTLYAIWEPLNKITVYDQNGNAHTGRLYIYDDNGNRHQCIISVYDENGNRKYPKG